MSDKKKPKPPKKSTDSKSASISAPESSDEGAASSREDSEIGFPRSYLPTPPGQIIPHIQPHSLSLQIKSQDHSLRLEGGADDEPGTSDGQRGQRRRRQRAEQPVEPIEPRLRLITLSDDRVNRANLLIREIKILADFEVDDLLCLLSYQNLLIDKPADYDPSVHELLEVTKLLHDEQASWQIRTTMDITDPFVDQLYHILRLAGLPQRSWRMLIHSVFFDDSEDNIKLVNRVIYASRYQGFDPSVILRKLIKSWQDGRRAPNQSFIMHYEGELGPEDWTYTNHEEFMNDMTILVLCFLNRGAVVGKILKKSARDYNALMRMLITKYNIRTNEEAERRRRAEALGPEIITLPRISACLCQLTTELYSRGFGRAIANFSEFGEVPVALFSPMFSSVVRKGYRDENGIMINLHPQLILINILVDNVLHVRDRVTPLDQIWTYFLASYNSGVLIDTARIMQCDRFGVTIEGQFIPALTRLRDHCIRRIRELRPHERMDDFIREMNQLN